MHGFVPREDGSLTLLSLIFFLLMFLIGGLAVDMLIFENNRTRLQNLTDRASLAAADMDQTVDAQTVVESYFEKEGMSKYLDGVTVINTPSAKSVEIQASQGMKTMFMRMVGTTDLTAPAGSKAIEAAGNVEISLVLDNSGSMGRVDGSDGKTRLEKLKVAVQTFLDVMYPDGADSHITVSIVPYATQVNAGPSITDYLNVTTEHTYSHCLEFEDTDFSALSLDSAKTYNRVAHFSMFETDENPTYFKCRTDGPQEIYIMGSDPALISNRVNGLTAQGQTSLELGAKWGAALLDPSVNPMVQSFLNDPAYDLLPSQMNRPVAYSDSSTVKALILMTDGINTFHYNMTSPYKSGPSPMWRDTGSLSEVFATVPGLSNLPLLTTLLGLGVDITQQLTFYTYQVTEAGDEDGDGILNETFWTPEVKVGGVTVIPEQFLQTHLSGSGSSTAPLDWPELWADMNPNWFAEKYILDRTGNQSDVNSFFGSLYTTVQPATKDARLDALCDSAKTRGLTVYTVGLNVSNHSRAVLRDCASTTNFYLDATSDNLEAKFQDIAESILNLKLRLVH